MGRKRTAPVPAAPPSSLERLRAETETADRVIRWVTWGCTAGMILWSMLNATPYVAQHVAEGWEDTAPVLPLVVDAAFVGALMADEIASRNGVTGGFWGFLLRLFTGAASVFLNVGAAAAEHDYTGVGQHLIAPGVLVLLAEVGPVYRRRLVARLRDKEDEERREQDRKRRQEQQDQDRKRDQEQQDADRERLQAQEDADRKRREDREDQDRRRREDREDEERRDKHALEAKRLELEERRLARTVPVPAAVPASVPVAPVAPVAAPGETALEARTAGYSTPVVAPGADTHTTAPQPRRTEAPVPVLAARTTPAPGQVHARITPETPAPATRPTGPVKDWDLPGLPETCAPGREPAFLTESQIHARMDYGLAQEWTQRRIGEFSGRSATVVNRYKAKLEQAV